MMYTYAGFLSYAHVDEAIASRLHRALETYKLPKGHTGTLSPIFRDTTELTAHHSLSEKIQGAVTGSRVLIVLCSPAAKVSHWVNEEIRLFRKIHGEASILCVLAEGTPETAFPPALLEGGREPLAANLGNTKESFRLGVTQIAAAMLGVGLDTLIQRDTRRKRRRLQAVTAGALVFSGLMGATTLSAVTAQKAAETNRMQAEGLVEYMITDLKEKLEPVGRLDILNGVGVRAVEYYDAQDVSKLPDDSLSRQARARHIIGEVALDSGEYDRARDVIDRAAQLTKGVYYRNPDDLDAIYAHAQSEYWAGAVYFLEGKYVTVQPFWENYSDLADKLYQTDKSELSWVMEKAWAANNIALLHNRMGKSEFAKLSYSEAEKLFEEALILSPNNYGVYSEIANVWNGMAQMATKDGDHNSALVYRWRQITVLQKHLDQNENDYDIRFKAAQARLNLLRYNHRQLEQEELDENIQICFKEYDRLLNYEPNNETWRTSYKKLLNFTKSNRNGARFRNLDVKSIEARLRNMNNP